MLSPGYNYGVDWLIGTGQTRGNLCQLNARGIFKVWEGLWNQKYEHKDLIKHLTIEYKLATRNSYKSRMTFQRPDQERNKAIEVQLKHIKLFMTINYCSCQLAYGLVNFMISYIAYKDKWGKLQEANLMYLHRNIVHFGNGYLSNMPTHINDDQFNNIYAFFQSDIKETKQVDWMSVLADNIPAFEHEYLTPIDDGQRLIHCPLHDDNRLSLGVNYLTKKWHCFAGCGGGQIPTLISKVTGKFWHELKPKYLTDEVKQIDISPQEKIDISPQEKNVVPIKKAKLIDTEPLYRFHSLITEDGFNLEHLTEWGVRQAARLSYAMPYIEDEEVIEYLVRFSNREADTEGRRFHLSKGFERSKHLLGIHRIEHNPKLLIVVEGGKDELRLDSFGYKSVALISADMSEHQLQLIRNLKPIELCLSFDNDLNGSGTNGLLKALTKLQEQPLPEVKISYINLQGEHKDFGDIKDKDIIDKYVTSRILWRN